MNFVVSSHSLSPLLFHDGWWNSAALCFCQEHKVLKPAGFIFVEPAQISQNCNDFLQCICNPPVLWCPVCCPVVHWAMELPNFQDILAILLWVLFSKLLDGLCAGTPTVRSAAKSLQSCLTLCNPTDVSPPGSPISGILQAGTLEWVAISFSNAWKWKMKVKPLSRVRLLATPWTTAYEAPPMGFSRQEYWSGLPLPSPTVRSTGAKSVDKYFIFRENLKVIPKHTEGNTYVLHAMSDILAKYFTVTSTKEIRTKHLYSNNCGHVPFTNKLASIRNITILFFKDIF